MATCISCNQSVNTKADEHYTCPSCGAYGEIILCLDCGIAQGEQCPECGTDLRLAYE